MSGRKPLPIIQQEAEILSDAKIGQSILNAIPDVAVILNDHRQIVAANQHCIDVLGLESVQLLLGIRPGDALKCIHSLQGTDGCGTGPACGQCGANLAIHKALSDHSMVEQECRITTSNGTGEISQDYLAKASFVRIGQFPLVLLVLRDISAEKRRQALERLFFHDVLNSVGGMAGLANLIVDGPKEKSSIYAESLQQLATNIAEEVTAYRNLLLAEEGTLIPNFTDVRVADVVREALLGLTIIQFVDLKSQKPKLTEVSTWSRIRSCCAES